ncbi:hypothetical protein SAMN05421858_0565 [Haladaptatus litoreus]|uniref:Uncharacterized protein n=1 Tax=Haladaptatus litoreus TaxID=553468 RepID=A0A1N6W1B9_9EURY|nr:hypothetical protein [Haladaptatus litoreus]SIQ83899.1 hypothetical protein SAMN05421858_0565 [Haladaptatus litoreus]
MRIDARDAATIGFASMGSLLGALVGNAAGNGNMLLWCGGGTVLDSAFSAYFLS